jgi:hypothetical protein
MALGADWKLYTSSSASPHAEEFSTHESLEAALTRACGWIMVPHQTALRIEGPNGEQYDQAYISSECARRRQQT